MPVETIPLFNRNEWSGTKIRNKIGRAEPWEGLLPRAVAKIIKAVKADERLQLLTKTDY
jgi:nicotinamide-nucleotide adenylyltransferase